MSSGVGSLVLALFWAARKISLSRAIASSSAAMLFSRPTKSCETICGNTTMSRRGSAGRLRRGGAPGFSFSFLKNMVRLADLGFFFVNEQRTLALHDDFFVDDD